MGEANSGEANIDGFLHIFKNRSKSSLSWFIVAAIALLSVAGVAGYFFIWGQLPESWRIFPFSPYMAIAPLFLPVCIFWIFSWTRIGRICANAYDVREVNKQLRDFFGEDDKIQNDEIIFIKKVLAEESKTDTSVALLALLASIMTLMSSLKEPTYDNLLLASSVLFLVGAGFTITLHGSRLSYRRCAAVLIAERQKQFREQKAVTVVTIEEVNINDFSVESRAKESSLLRSLFGRLLNRR